MSKKVTNIYIDTTGFCDDALRRVIAATDVIVEHNGVEKYGPICSKAHIAFDEFDEWNYCASNCNQEAAEVGLLGARVNCLPLQTGEEGGVATNSQHLH